MSLARPAGNITGMQMFTTALENKRFGLLHEVVPNVSAVAALIDPSRAAVAQAQVAELAEAANAAGARLIVVNATTEADFVPAFAKAIEDGAGAMQVCANPNFFAMREQLFLGRPLPTSDYLRMAGVYACRRPNELRHRFSRRLPSRRWLRGQNPERREAGRAADYATDQIRFRHQSQELPKRLASPFRRGCSPVADEVIE